MSGKDKTTPIQDAYQQLQGKHEIKRPIVKNCLKAFLVGGIFCIVGQAISYFYIYFFNFTEQTAGGPTTATMVFLALLMTGFGFYDRIGQFGGQGVPSQSLGSVTQSFRQQSNIGRKVLYLELDPICLNWLDRLFYSEYSQPLSWR